MFNISDLHNDLLTSGLTQKSMNTYLTKAVGDGGLKAVNLAVWTSKMTGGFYDVNSAFLQISKKTKLKLVFSIEDLHFINRDNLHLLRDCPAVCCSLTWNDDNVLGGGAFGSAGLTRLGKAVLREMESSCKALDTAHLNRRTFYDCLKNFRGLIINTHCGFDGVHIHPRNISSSQISELIDRDGLIGLTLVSEFLTSKKQADVFDVVRSIDYFVSKFPYEHLCIGTDFYGTKNLPKNMRNYKNMPVLVEKLIKMGYNSTVINGILYENMLRCLY